MRKITIVLITISLVIISCKNANKNNSDLFTKVYNTDKIESQSFSIQSDKDTVIKGKSGTIIKIYKNTFVDDSGKPVEGTIQVELKEALTMHDIVMANLITTTNGKFLQTGGMIYLNASLNNTPLQIAPNMEIGVIVPTNEFMEGMSVFEGVKDSNSINWIDPVAILNQNLIPGDSTNTAKDVGPKDTVATDTTNDAVKGEIVLGNEIEMPDIGNIGIFYQEVNVPKGVNYFIQDYNTSYIFTVKKLGWANIDRLYYDQRTKNVEFITSIENSSSFDQVYITLVTEKMFLPGYQMKNGTYGFTHDDDEKPMLPVGAPATILATSYKNDQPYFSIKKITISDKQKVSLKLEKTTIDDLKKQLETQL